MPIRTLWHVTGPEAAEAILDEGFAGGWGDDGFGVYLFSSLPAARVYAAEGGWDAGLEAPVLLEVEAEADEVCPILPDPAWPNPEDYVHVLVHPMDPDAEEARWSPRRRVLGLEAAPSPGPG